jgi:hypothetical protein
MISSLQTALMVGPLSILFLTLGIWHSGRRPHVVPGALDFGMLVFGLLGLMAFGPIGQFLVERLFPGSSLWAWLAVPTFFGLLAMLWAPRTARRVVVYNINPEVFRSAIRDVVKALPGGFRESPDACQASDGQAVLTFEVGERSRIALVVARGAHPEIVAHMVAMGLRHRLGRERSRPPVFSKVWFALAAFVLIGPSFSVVLSRPHIQAAWRVLLDQIRR